MARIGMAPQRWIRAGLCVLALALPSLAQDPKPGDFYEDNTDLGFKVRVPAKWQSIPPAPDDGNLVIKYDPKSNKAIRIGKDKNNREMLLDLHVWVVKFDRRKTPGAAPEKDPDKTHVARYKTLDLWLKGNVSKGFNVVKGSEKQLQVNKIEATEYVYSNTTLADNEVKLYAMVYKLHPEVDIAFVGWGPGEGSKWTSYERAFKDMARSLKSVELEADAAPLAEGSTLRDKKRAELADMVTRTPGWKLYESPNYFIISDYPKKDFLDELMGRLEAIRAVYEADYPAAKAEEIRAAAARLKTGGGDVPKAGEDEQEPATAPAEAKPPSNDAMEMSRCSIVRVCKNEDEYFSYGGPPSSAGYWSSNAKELVIFDDSAQGGKGNTWITLNHEAFHQYIYYFYGNIAPHSWYNEGTGDFYSGYMYKNGRFTLKENPWRKDLIKKAIREETFIPLKDIFRYKQSEYYNGELVGDTPRVGICYAQGWSMIYFLRTGKKNNAKGWDPKWDNLLEDYLKVLAATGNPEQAIEQCLTGIDVDALQSAWIDYTK